MTVEQPDAGLAWSIQIPDPFGLPRRLAYAIVAFGPWYWLFAVVLAPAALFASAVTVDSRGNVALLGLVGAHWLIVWGIGSGYRDAVVTVDLEAASLTHSCVRGVIRKGAVSEQNIDLGALAEVRTIPAGRQTIVRLDYDGWYWTGPLAVVIPSSRVPELVDAFETADVSVRTASQRQTLARLLVTVAVLVVLPIVSTAMTGTVGGNVLVFFLVVLSVWVIVQVVGGVRRVYQSLTPDN